MKKVFLALACTLIFASCTESGNNNKEQSQDNQQVTASDDGVVADTLDINGYVNRARWYLANQQVGNAIRDINNALSIDGKNKYGSESSATMEETPSNANVVYSSTLALK